MTRNSTETMAREAYLWLPERDKRIVQTWRDLGNDWFTSVVNSGVLAPSGLRLWPEQYDSWAEQRDKRDQLIAKRQAERYREGAEHEAAHAILAKSFDLKVKLAHIQPDGTGACHYEPAQTPFQTATIALAGETWINVFRSREFPCGATGCEKDQQKVRDACRDGVLIDHAYRQCYLTLKANKDAVLALVDRIERDGHYMP